MRTFRFAVLALVFGIVTVAGCGSDPEDQAEDQSTLLGGPGRGLPGGECHENLELCPSSGQECCNDYYCWCQPVCWYDESCQSLTMCYDDYGYWCASLYQIGKAAAGICSVPSCRPR